LDFGLRIDEGLNPKSKIKNPKSPMPLTAIPGFADPFSSLSHLIGAGIFLALSWFLVRRGRGDWLRVASLVVFSAGSVALLSISGVYHLTSHDSNVREVMQKLDHAAIFVLIACSFTPLHIILFRGWGRWGMLTVVWLYAYAAIAIKSSNFNTLPQGVGLAMYLGMGWLGAFSGISIWRRYGYARMAPILWGGIAYSIGAVLEFVHWPVIVAGVVQWHEVFHIAVLIGLGFHWALVYSIADGRLTPPPVSRVDAREACSLPVGD
jgi:channel protein (hemolysin III family)